jgi:hypothetical protein
LLRSEVQRRGIDLLVEDDADVAQPRRRDRTDFRAQHVAADIGELQLELLAVLLAHSVGAYFPACLVQQRARRRGIVVVHGQIVRIRPAVRGDIAVRGLVDIVGQVVCHRFAVERVLDRLSHAEIG